MEGEEELGLKGEGGVRGDFLDQQLEGVKANAAEWVDSGLALDVLAFHTTPLLTAKERSREELLTTYKHRAGDIPALVQEMPRLFLPSDTSRDDEQRATRLCHDTMAPLGRQRYDKSETPAQRARRINESALEASTDASPTRPADRRSLCA